MKMTFFTVSEEMHGRQARKGRTAYLAEKAFLDIP
jgi:hypothetical protein